MKKSLTNSREVFVKWLSKKTKEDPSIILIVADVGFGYLEEFAKEFPNNFLNVGVIEQSMIGIAAGLAKKGFKPYCYSMIPFILFRPYEYVRNDLCYHDLNVKLMGVQGSEHYKFLGFSHNILKEENEDLVILSLLPNMTAYVPKEIEQIEQMLEKMYESSHPCYMRL